MFTTYTAKVPIRPGEFIQFDDGPKHHVIDRGERGDKLIVETQGAKEERHIDWFYEKGAEADRVIIK